jgi:hypothetical protein
VELRVVFPRRLLTSTAGAVTRPGLGLPKILAEEREGAESYDRDRRRIDDWLHHPGRAALAVLLLGLGPGLALLFATYAIFGRERGTGYDREYEQEPPSNLEPALVPPLLKQESGVGSLEFTATLFDLIRRGYYNAEQVTTERSLWGGLRREDVADLALNRANGVSLTPWERTVAHIVDGALPDADGLLSRLRDGIEEHRTQNAKRFQTFKSGSAGSSTPA